MLHARLAEGEIPRPRPESIGDLAHAVMVVRNPDREHGPGREAGWIVRGKESTVFETSSFGSVGAGDNYRHDVANECDRDQNFRSDKPRTHVLRLNHRLEAKRTTTERRSVKQTTQVRAGPSD